MRIKDYLTVRMLGMFLGWVIFSNFLWAATYTVTNTSNSGAGSLRQAILDANANAGLDTIDFNIPGAGPHTIQPASVFPTITSPVIIDGWSQGGGGYTGPPLIEIDGSLAGNAIGLYFGSGSSGSTIQGLVINRFTFDGIWMDNDGNHTIKGCYIGTDVTGTINRGNGRYGICIYMVPNVTVGGTAEDDRNIISCNEHGIFIFGPSSTGNRILGNYIGTDITGTADFGNTQYGVYIYSSDGNAVGGTADGSRNLISGNNGAGVFIFDGNSNTIEGNYIGPDVTGTVAIRNRGYGGVYLQQSNNNIIGGTTATARNIISSNVGHGVYLYLYSTGNKVWGNYIGTDVNGTANLFNTDDGVNVNSYSDNNQIGGTGNGEANIIAYNWEDGVHISSTACTGNLISGNSIFSNNQLGIELWPQGVTTNDDGDGDTGANNLQNYPVIDTVILTSTTVEIGGTLNSTPDTTFTIEFFSNSVLDSSGHGEGETYLGSKVVTTDSSGNVSFTEIFPVAVPAGYYITSTATDPNNNTSEFSEAIESPTLAVISSFQAYEEGGQVVIQWETSSENSTVGFDLLRKDPSPGKYQWVYVNRDFLPGLLHSPQGGIYRLKDPMAFPGQTYSYKLIEVEARGGKKVYGPFNVTVGHQEMVARSQWETVIVPDEMHGTYNKYPHPIPGPGKTRLQARQLALDIARIQKKSRKGEEAKIVVKEKGLYYLETGTIARVMGISPEQAARKIVNRHFLLTLQGQKVAYLPAEGTAGLYFYGEDIHSIYTDENIYWLKKSKGLTMAAVDGGMPIPTGSNQTFTDALHIEEDRYALTALFDDPTDDYWLWDFIPGRKTRDFKFSVPGAAAQGTSSLTVHLKGATDTTANVDHHVEVNLNGTLIGEGQWKGLDTLHLRLSFDQSLLIDGENTIELTNKPGPGVPYSIFYLDSFDLSYKRYYRAVNNMLICRADGNPVITIEGFTHSNILVLDITEPRQPKKVTRTSIDVDNHRVSFIPAHPERTYLAAALPGVPAPPSVIADKPSKLKQIPNSTEYLMIVPGELKDTLQDLETLRQAKGLKTALVELEDIYDEFNHGISNPEAIKAFISYMYGKSNKNGLQYVVLVGEGTYDYKNNQGYSDNLVPVILTATPYGLFASDTYYADVEGNDGVPEIAVGRLPVITSQELQTLINKIYDYEYANTGGWTARIMMLADNPDKGGDFPDDSSYLASLVPGDIYSIDKIHLPDFSTVNEARQKVMQGFNQGALLVNYIGHAGLNCLAAEGLLRSEDISFLQNGTMLPVITAMTCVVGRFAIPGYDTLSELLVLKDSGGASAVWAPSGASLNPLARKLAEGLFIARFQQQEKIIGKVLLKAMQYWAAFEDQTFMLKIYTLLGDPAMEMK